MSRLVYRAELSVGLEWMFTCVLCRSKRTRWLLGAWEPPQQLPTAVLSSMLAHAAAHGDASELMVEMPLPLL